MGAASRQFERCLSRLTLMSGQANFEVVHEPDRAFRVVAGAARVVDLGTKFDVRLQHDSTIVTVIEGRVAVAPWARTYKQE